MGTTGEHNSLHQVSKPDDIDWDRAPSRPSAVDDAATAMMESAAKDKEIAKLKKQLQKKPKEIIKEVEKEADLKIKTPASIKKLEKKLQEKLDGK